MIDEKKKIQLARLAGHVTAMGHTYHVFNRRSGLFFFKILVPTYRSKAQHKTASP